MKTSQLCATLLVVVRLLDYLLFFGLITAWVQQHPSLKAIHFAANHWYPNDNVNNELEEMYEKGDCGNLNDGKLFVNQKDNIQWH